MLHEHICCIKAKYNQFLDIVFDEMESDLDKMKANILFGHDPTCEFNIINDLVHLKEKLDYIRLNDTTDNTCLEKTSAYFMDKKIDVSEMYSIYGLSIY